MVPSWMRNVTFIAWLVSMFAPPSLIPADSKPYVAAGFTLVMGAAVGPGVLDKFKGGAVPDKEKTA